MDLKGLLAISGKPGLYKHLTQTKNGIIVESLLDQKRMPAYASAKISALEDIAIYTEDEDMPLADVFKKMFEKTDGKEAISHKSANEELKAFFEEVIPTYDQERVYVSDIKKVISWYNLLVHKNMLDFSEEKEEAPSTGEKKEDPAEDHSKEPSDTEEKDQ